MVLYTCGTHVSKVITFEQISSPSGTDRYVRCLSLRDRVLIPGAWGSNLYIVYMVSDVKVLGVKSGVLHTNGATVRREIVKVKVGGLLLRPKPICSGTRQVVVACKNHGDPG